MNIPYFLGGIDPYIYLKWVQQMENIFDYFKLSDFQKCRLASRKFLGRATTWWEDLMALWRESRHCEITNWEIMKKLMTRYFIPQEVRDKFCLKLQRIK